MIVRKKNGKEYQYDYPKEYFREKMQIKRALELKVRIGQHRKNLYLKQIEGKE